MKMSFIKMADGSLAPTGDQAKAYTRMAPGEEIVLDIKKQRNPKFHRLAFSWLNAVFENQDRYDAFPQFRAALTVAAGYVKCTITKHRKGRVTCTNCSHSIEIETEQTTVIPESLSFENMDEGEFQEWQKNTDRVLMSAGINTEIGMH